ncbi:MAG: zf-HC2 domain-containing protein [Gaiellaceae bacterium]
MLPFVPPRDCSSAREQISLRLDAELPELDEVRLDAHLTRCAACRAFRRDLESLTAAVRGAPLLEPDRSLNLAGAGFRRARRRVPRSLVAAVSTGVAAAATVGLLAGLGPSTPFGAQHATAMRIVQEQLTLKEQQLDQLDALVKSGPPRPVTPGTGPDPTTGV